MTGIVVVSHSRALADAAVELATEMVQGMPVQIAVAAGLDATTLGTDAVAIMSALVEADDGDGVVVLMDLGSAVLSAELARDLVEPDLRQRVVLCPAPLVEGLVVAAVAAAGGARPDEVAEEAIGSLAAKEAHAASTGLSNASPTSVAAINGTVPEAHRTFTVANRHGLHARPAARLVREARGFDALLQVRNLTTGAGPVPATSLSSVATLGALHGHQVEIFGSGYQAREAVDHLKALAERNFDEPQERIAVTTSSSATRDQPIPASPGIAIGPVVTLRLRDIVAPDEPSHGPAAEWERVHEAIAAVRQDTALMRAETAKAAGAAEAAIFDAHLLLLEDSYLLDDVRRRIDFGATGARAWEQATATVETDVAALSDAYMSERSVDVRSVSQQVLRALVGATDIDLPGEGVLVAHELTPAQVSGLDPSRIRGIVTADGSPTGHAAILARARGIPALVAAGQKVLQIPDGATVAIDGTSGELVVDPAPDVIAVWRERDLNARTRVAVARAAAIPPALTRDGAEILVGANLGSVADAEAAASAGADLAGLVRTEFLFLDRPDAPGVEEQVETYRALAAALGGKRLTLRTLDVGGDKPLSYAPQRPEANPFLGVRGIRFALRESRLFHDQLAAIVEVAHDTPVSVMFPMVSTVSELTEARRRLQAAIASAGRGVPEGLQVGIMVEVPSAALKAAAFVAHVDFFSIGTNDLTQYTLAAERGSAELANLADPLDPAVLTLIDDVCKAAGAQALVAVCGELAADEQAVPLLTALGVRELSVAPLAVPGVKQAIRGIVAADDVELVKRCLSATSPGEVRALLP